MKKERKERIVKMVEMELEMDDSLIEPMKKYALETIRNDEKALLNYAVNKALEFYVDKYDQSKSKGKK